VGEGHETCGNVWGQDMGHFQYKKGAGSPALQNERGTLHWKKGVGEEEGGNGKRENPAFQAEDLGFLPQGT